MSLSKEERDSIRRIFVGRVVPQSSDIYLLKCLYDLDDRDKEIERLKKRVAELETVLDVARKYMLLIGAPFRYPDSRESKETLAKLEGVLPK